jgi:thiol-disulfide isomerase/thioredoxin
VRVKFFQSVITGLAAFVGVGCATPTREGPGKAAAPSAQATQAAPSPSVSEPLPSSSVPPNDSPPPSRASSAYPGCGQPIPAEELWTETSEAEVRDAIPVAQACALEHGRRLLLEFVAPWCDDCREMARLEATPAVAQALKRRYERVRINVGKWDRHEALRNRFGVRALATYIVIEPKSSDVLAKTTLEPITKPGAKLTADDWRAWLERY